jgi:hypothetical protein
MLGDWWGESPHASLTEAKASEAQGRRREAGSERSVEQTREPMDKNRIRGSQRRTSMQPNAKSTSIKGAGCKPGGCARKVVELTSGDLPSVRESGLRIEQSVLIRRQKSAEGIVCAEQRIVQEG